MSRSGGFRYGQGADGATAGILPTCRQGAVGAGGVCCGFRVCEWGQCGELCVQDA